VVSAGLDFARMPMFAEFINDLGRRITVPYVTPTTQALADVVAEAAKSADSIFMANHGFCALGANMKQAFYRSLIVEDAAKSIVAAAAVGKPQILTPEQETDLMSQAGPQHRIKVMEGKQ
jgi:L-fuculose-phosphate aldolase